MSAGDVQILQAIPLLQRPPVVEPPQERSTADETGDDRVGCRESRFSCCELGFGYVKRVGCRLRVDAPVTEVKLVAARAAVDHRRLQPGPRGRSTDLADDCPQCGLPGPRKAVRPQLVGDLVAAQRMPVLDREHRQDEAALIPREVTLTEEGTTVFDCELADDRDPHARTIATGGSRVRYLVECDCGWSCRGEEEEIVVACAEHGREVHGLELSREQILEVAQRVEADDTSAPAKG